MGKDEQDTSAIHDEPVRTMGRRRFVDTLLSVGFSMLSATFLTAEDVRAAGQDEVPVVYGLARDGDSDLRPKRTTVPVDWHNDFRSAVAVHRNLRLVAREDVASSAVEPGEYGGHNSRIRVEITDERVRGEIPESVEKVPVEVTQVRPREERNRPMTDEPDSSFSVGNGIPGSVAIASEKLYGTLAPAMRDPTDGSVYFGTANHVYGGTDNSGEPLYLLDDGQTEIGEVAESYPKADLVCARPKSDYQPVARIHNGEPGWVLGQFTKVGLADLKANDEPLEKIGVKTGHTKGKIQAVDGLTCAYGAICKQGQLKWGRESGFADGDSGSVNYHPDPDDPDAGVLVGGFNNARTWWPGEDYIWGTTAYHITERYGYTF